MEEDGHGGEKVGGEERAAECDTIKCPASPCLKALEHMIAGMCMDAKKQQGSTQWHMKVREASHHGGEGVLWGLRILNLLRESLTNLAIPLGARGTPGPPPQAAIPAEEVGIGPLPSHPCPLVLVLAPAPWAEGELTIMLASLGIGKIFAAVTAFAGH